MQQSHPTLRRACECQSIGMIVARYCRAASDRKQGAGVLKEPGHIVGIKRSVLETTCPLAVALLPMAVLIILAMTFFWIV